MTKLIFDARQQEYTLTLNATQLQLVDTLLAHIQLGTGNKFSEAAYELSSIIEQECPTSKSMFFRKQIKLRSLNTPDQRVFMQVTEGPDDAE